MKWANDSSQNFLFHSTDYSYSWNITEHRRQVVLLRIRKVTVSNLGMETGNPDWGLSLFSSVPVGEFRNGTL
jgi:hypothetical protein